MPALSSLSARFSFCPKLLGLSERTKHLLAFVSSFHSATGQRNPRPKVVHLFASLHHRRPFWQLTMRKMKPFKEEYSFEERIEESKEIVAKYPDRVPVIAERFSRSDLPDMEKKKFLVPRDMSVGQFIHILSRRLHLAPGKALFVFVDNILPQTSSLLESLYDSHKDEDGFLYMYYSSEKTFG